MQNEGFGRTVNVDIRNRLICRNGSDIDDMCSLLHIRNGQLAERDNRSAIEVDHIQIDFHGGLCGGTEFAEATRIDQKSDIRFFFFQKSGVGFITFFFGKVECDGTGGERHGIGKLLQAFDSSCDDPDFIKISCFLQRFGKFFMYLFTADGFEGEMKECDEGELRWVSREFLDQLPKWEGDQIFLDLLWQDAPFFLLKLRYDGDKLVEAVLNGNKIK